MGAALSMSDFSQTDAEITRHFTATGFVVEGDSVLLHWHRKVKAWLPPGGHVEPNEDPVQAVLREILEETGLHTEVVGDAPDLGLDYPEQVAPPFTIMIEDIHDPVDGFHRHIDMIYFCRPSGPVGPLNTGWRWVTRRDLADGVALEGYGGESEPPPEDVRRLAERAFQALEGAG
jgi:8-oxo-dGTP pyrophosphatase MutT (NUDIX family)